MSSLAPKIRTKIEKWREQTDISTEQKEIELHWMNGVVSDSSQGLITGEIHVETTLD